VRPARDVVASLVTLKGLERVLVPAEKRWKKDFVWAMERRLGENTINSWDRYILNHNKIIPINDILFLFIIFLANVYHVNSIFKLRISKPSWRKIEGRRKYIESPTYLLLSPLEGLDEWLQWQEVRATIPESWPLECKDVADASRPFKVPVDRTACFPPPPILKVAHDMMASRYIVRYFEILRCSKQ